MGVIDHARLLRKQIETQAYFMTDTDALSHINFFPKWNGNSVEYSVNTRLRYGDALYKVQKDHVSEPTEFQDIATEFYALVTLPDPEAILDWKQPDHTNPYMADHKVIHAGKTWQSSINYNIWEPGVYGWAELIPST